MITIRLSIRSFAGMVLTDVAVGTSIEASILVASDLDIPLRIVTWSCSCSAESASIVFIRLVIGAWAGIGCGFASIRVVFATRFAAAGAPGLIGAIGVIGTCAVAGVAGVAEPEEVACGVAVGR